MNHLVKLLTDDDGAMVTRPFWHLVDPTNNSGPMALCTGEYFGRGESACTYEEKRQAGGITCPDCREKLRIYRAVRVG